MRNIRLVGLALLAALLAGAGGRAMADGGPASCPAPPEAGKLSAIVVAVNVETRTIVVQPQAPCTIIVSGGDAQHVMATLSAGDTISAKVAADGTSGSVLRTNPVAHPSVFERLGVMLLVAALIVGLAALGSRLNPRALMTGLDNRFSNSQTQLVLWSLTALTAYLSTVLFRMIYGYGSGHWADFIGGVGMPENVLALSGISALTFGGAKAVTTQKIADQQQQARLAQQQGLAEPANPKAPGNNAPKVTDLFQNDNSKADIGDTQMILITLIAVVLYLMKTFAFLGQIELAPSVVLPDVDTALLSGFGVGQAAYLAKKAGSKLGDG